MSRPKAELLDLYLQKRANLLRYFAARLGSNDAAEDLVQDIYFKLAAMTEATAIDNPSAFLYRVGANLMLDRLRRDQRQRQRDEAWSDSRRPQGGEAADEPSPVDALDARRRLQNLADALAELPPQMQRAFRLHRIDGASQADTARAMGISVSAVEKHVAAALRTLLRRLS